MNLIEVHIVVDLHKRLKTSASMPMRSIHGSVSRDVVVESLDAALMLGSESARNILGSDGNAPLVSVSTCDQCELILKALRFAGRDGLL
jgi:hypothetical protein